MEWAENGINLGDYFSEYLIKDVLKLNRNDIAITGGFGSWKLDENFKFVWGRGFFPGKINNEEIQKSAIVKAVRGKFSYYNYLNFKQQYSYIATGDPGLLASTIYKCESNKKYKIGIIPHWYDRKTKIDFFRRFADNSDILFLPIDGDADIEKFWRKINECEIILTSSLHGSVFAHSYGIPSYYICLDDDYIPSRNRDYKFKDYYSNFENIQLRYFYYKDQIFEDSSRMTDYFLSINQNLYNPTKQQIESIKNKLIMSFPENIMINAGYLNKIVA